MRRVVFDQREQVARWVCDRIGGFVHDGVQALGYESNGRLIAGCMVDRYVGRSVCMHIAGKGAWARPDFLRHCFTYVFHTLGCIKALGLVDSSNAAAIRLNQALGFQLEAVVRDGAAGGDLLIFSMTAAQCRWLGEPHG